MEELKLNGVCLDVRRGGRGTGRGCAEGAGVALTQPPWCRVVNVGGGALLGTDLRVWGKAQRGGSPNRDTRRERWRPLDVKLVAGNSYLMEIRFPGTFPSETTFFVPGGRTKRVRVVQTGGFEGRGEGGALRSWGRWRASESHRGGPETGFRNDQAGEGFWWSRVEGGSEGRNGSGGYDDR